MNRKPVSHKLQLDNTIIEYTVLRDRRRKKTVQISVFNDNIAVSAPIRTPDHEIQAILWTRSDWILNKLAKMSAGSKELPLPELATGDALPYSERQLPSVVEESERVANWAKQIALEKEAEKRRLESERDKPVDAQQQAGQRKQEAEGDQQAALTHHNADVKKPELQDFDVTADQYALYQGHPTIGILFPAIVIGFLVYIPLAVWLAVSFGALGIVGAIILIFFVPIGIACLVQWPVVQFIKRRMVKGPVASQIRLYKEAEDAYQAAQEEAEMQRLEVERVRQEAERRRKEAKRAKKAALLAQQRKQEEYWESLSGIAFERELGKLYRAQGYSVKSTPTSGDQGVDLILTKNGKTTVVQCKAHKSPIGPSVARELFGSMHHFKADNAILACTGGFTDGVIKFARGKPISLISAWDIARMAEESGSATQEIAVDPPICPKDGCGRTMVVRNGRLGRFWGCPRYPTCRGTRDFNEFKSVGTSVPIPDEDSKRLF